MKLRAYLDNNATTRLAPEALAAMMPYLTDVYLNPSSAAGELAGAAQPIVDARRALGALFGDVDAGPRFLLTSGASEANSWAVHIATRQRASGHLVSSAIEHPSLLAALADKADAGWSVSLARPGPDGRLSPSSIAPLLRDDTALVSLILANNETGILQPIEEVSALVRELVPQALVHVDATQAVGRIPLSLQDKLASVDLLSLSAHKFHGPKGCGALFVAEDLDPRPLIHGSQQDGRRGGTPDVASAAGLAVAARLAGERLAAMSAVAALRDRFERGLAERVRELRIVGKDVPRLPNTSCFMIPGADADSVVDALALDGIVMASGAACTSGSSAPSHVLTAMGISHADARSAFRVSLSADTSGDELDLAIDRLALQVLAHA